MNVPKFLLIDAALVIASIPFIFQRGKNSSRLGISNKEGLFRKTSFKLPYYEKLIELEKLAKDKGSGIKFDSILGDWKFVRVWKENIDKEDLVFSSLLRIFSAKIEFKRDVSTEDLLQFSITTSIRFGFFSLKFSGSGYLKGKQPLLKFFFNLIELKSDSNILFSRSLREPEEEKKPFFAFIALEENGRWLSARGQAGAMMVLLKE